MRVTRRMSRLLIRTLGVCVASTIPITCLLGWLQEGRYKNTHMELNAFASALSAFSFDNGRIPAMDLKGCVTAMLRHPQYAAEVRKMCPMLIDNKDGWGRPFVFIVDQKRQRAVVRSVGLNGRDEKGEGDDMTREVNLKKE